MMLSVVILVLNEAATIPQLIRRLRAALPATLDFELISVNDGSTECSVWAAGQRRD